MGWAADRDSSLNDRKHMLDIWGLQILPLETGEVDGCVWSERGVCVCVCVCVFVCVCVGCEGAVEEGDAASNCLPHPLDAALNSSLPSKL